MRALAEELVVNPNTVARAYTDLGREGLIESRAGRGVFVTRKRKMFTREEGRRRLGPLLEGLIGEAMVMDFSQEELREAFDKKLSQCQWNSKKGADSNNEPKNSTCDQPQRTQRTHRKELVMIPNQRTDSPAG